MTPGLRELGIRSVLLDIEGTTTPIAFVHDVLFPYARANVSRFLDECATADDVRIAVQLLHSEWRNDVAAGRVPPEWQEQAGNPDTDSVSRYVGWLMDRDRKSPGLKALQGLIWQRGYRAGLLRGEVFDDVPPAMNSWRRAGLDVAIYSSGSVLAQQLLFETTRFGDLTRLMSAFFDTAVGPKTSPESYRRIADALGRRPPEILFISDVGSELGAARATGLQVILSIRPGNPMQQIGDGIPIVRSFDEITT